jgi:hypothetical protein
MEPIITFNIFFPEMTESGEKIESSAEALRVSHHPPIFSLQV